MLRDIADIITALAGLAIVVVAAAGFLVSIGLPLGAETGHTLVSLAQALIQG